MVAAEALPKAQEVRTVHSNLADESGYGHWERTATICQMVSADEFLGTSHASNKMDLGLGESP